MSRPAPPIDRSRDIPAPRIRFPVTVRKRFTALLLATVTLLPPAAWGYGHCPPGTERSIIDALVNYQPAAAADHLVGFDANTALIPSRDFYLGLVDWRRGRNNEDAGQVSLAISQIKNAVDTLERQYRQAMSAGTLAALGIARGHFARILLDSEYYREAWSAGSEAISEITRFLETSSVDHPARMDALMLQGLYEIYLSMVPEELTWLIGRRDRVSDATAGIGKLQLAIAQSNVFPAEAARALLMETPWQLPRICNRIPLARQMREHFPDNADLAIVLQGLLLRCGHPQEALTENTRALRQFGPDHRSHELLRQGRLRALADTTNIEALSSSGESDLDLELLRRLALGNALDLQGRREDALSSYRTLLSLAPRNHRTTFRVRPYLAIPYRKPRTVFPSGVIINLPSC